MSQPVCERSSERRFSGYSTTAGAASWRVFATEPVAAGTQRINHTITDASGDVRGPRLSQILVHPEIHRERRCGAGVQIDAYTPSRIRTIRPGSHGHSHCFRWIVSVWRVIPLPLRWERPLASWHRTETDVSVVMVSRVRSSAPVSGRIEFSFERRGRPQLREARLIDVPATRWRVFTVGLLDARVTVSRVVERS